MVIVGGGMVGSSLAAGLAQHPALANTTVVLLEGAPEKPYVAPPSGETLKNIGGTIFNLEIAAINSGLIFVRTFFDQQRKCSPFLKLTPTF